MAKIPRSRDVDIVVLIFLVEGVVAYAMAIALGATAAGVRAWPNGNWADPGLVLIALAGAVAVGFVIGWRDWMERRGRTVDFRELWTVSVAVAVAALYMLWQSHGVAEKEDILLFTAAVAFGMAVGLAPTRDWHRNAGSD